MYDLAAVGVLYMRPFADIEGSGEGTTLITRPGDAGPNEGTIRIADNSELRRVTIENRGGAAYAVAVNFQGASNARLSHVTALASEGGTATYAIYVQGGGATVEDSSVVARHSNYYAVGLLAAQGAAVVVRRCHVVSDVVSGDAQGLTNGQSDVRVFDSTIAAHGTGNVLGIYVAGYGNVPSSNGSLIANSVVSADGGADAHGIEVAGGASADLVGVRAQGKGSGLRLRTTGAQTGTTQVRSVASVFDGGIASLGGGYDTRLTGGQIRGGASGSGYKCAFVSDESFEPLTAMCTP